MSNRLEVTGNLGKDPALKTIKIGNEERPVCEFSVFADNYKRDEKSGEYVQDGGFWVSVSIWGDRARNCFKHLRKGARVTCEGKLSIDEYESKENNGEQRYSLRLTADNVTLELSRIESVTFKPKRENEE
ncbi:MAG: single-stranded DNA-binding protein [Betaproteobacteria bacterium]|nr:MAG: single-stranded DNA-binding protein [Betaproteobacteria bacterium]